MRVAVITLAGLSLAACASITRGTTDQVSIMSNPPGAEVRTTNGLQCITPCSLPISRKTEFVATFTKEGYEPMSVPVVTRVAGAGAAGFVGNAVVGGVIGMGVDVVTGAAMDHCPNPLAVTLKPIRRADPPRGGRPGPVAVPINPGPDPTEQCKLTNEPEVVRSDVR